MDVRFSPFGSDSLPKSLSDFLITSGQVVEGPGLTLIVVSLNSRGQLREGIHQGAKVSFRFSRRGSGVSRFGLKLRARDSCNVLTVMWRFEPREAIVVKLKRNPGQHTHAECGSHGYQTLSEWSPNHFAYPTATENSNHTLKAELRIRDLANADLFVTANDFQFPVVTIRRSDQLDFTGPVGFRSDQVQVEFQFSAWSSPLPDSGLEQYPT